MIFDGMKFKKIAVAVMMASALTACDDTTDFIGTSLTDNMDHLKVVADTFTVTTRSIAADSVLSFSNTGYLGKVKDPETNTFISSNFMVQFHTLENTIFPDKASITSLKNGEVIADSAEICLYYTDLFGDTLAPMRLTAYEMSKPMEEGTMYYSNFDPMENGFINSNAYHTTKVYTLTDMSLSESDKGTNYTPFIRVKLDNYTDKTGKHYNNFGTYIMRKYYEDLEDDGKAQSFSNAYNLIHKVIPGFYFKTSGGIGAMPYIKISQLNIHFQYKDYVTSSSGKKDSLAYLNTWVSFAGTEEVLQTNTIINDKAAINNLVQDNTCTYLKTPAGIFTEMTLPVEDIVRGHEKDTLNTAKVVLTRLNNKVNSDYSLDVPSTLLMIPKDSIYTFFEHNKSIDYQTAFYAQYKSTDNTYTFNNISGMISFMKNIKNSGKASNDWNKVVIIPVSLSTSTDSYTQMTTINKVVHDMSLTSTRLVGGSNNPNGDIKISVIYSKFE